MPGIACISPAPRKEVKLTEVIARPVSRSGNMSRAIASSRMEPKLNAPIRTKTSAAKNDEETGASARIQNPRLLVPAAR